MQLLVLLLLSIVHVFCVKCDRNVEDYFRYFQIVPTYLKTAPEKAADIRFNNIVVDMGNEISSFIAQIPPYIAYDSDPNELYSVLFVDLDYPSFMEPVGSPYLLWLVMNVRGMNVNGGDEVCAQKPPNPYPGSGFHRYAFLIYKQPDFVDIETKELLLLRGYPKNFSLFEFSERYNVGDPIAGNFFTSEMVVCGYRNDDRDTSTCS